MCFALFVAGLTGSSAVAGEFDDRVEATLARHVDGEAIGVWLETLGEASLERDGAEWILAWLPLSDLATLDSGLLREHVEYAARAYREAPWREDLPRDLWLRYVVPHRAAQEPLQRWRPLFYEELRPRIAGAPSMEAAALAVNRWCREQATFISTSARDMGPLTTLKRGLARCGEETILTVCALRAAGLPARSCATPYWTFTDNNHAWVEVWADGGWRYLGGCEPDRCLDRAWFTDAARRAGFVRSVAYGQFEPGDEPVYRSEKGSTIINSTAVYTTPFRLTARAVVEGIDDAPMIHVNVFNFGALRPIASIRSGESIELGPGEYALTAGRKGRLLMEVVRGGPGDRVEVLLDGNDRYDMNESPRFWLRYPEGEAAPVRDVDLVSDEEERILGVRIAAREADRAKLRAPDKRERAMLDSLAPAERARVDSILTKPMEKTSIVFILLSLYERGEERAALLDFLEMADDKDLLEMDERAIRSHVDSALRSRRRLAADGVAIPDSIWRDFVLAGRIDEEEGGAWREGLPLPPLEGDLRARVEDLLALCRDRLEIGERTFFGHPLDPADCWRLRIGTERDLGVCLTGLLRVNGIPARYRHGMTEVWTGDFVPVDPLTGEVDGEVGGGGEPADMGGTITGGRGTLSISITRGGLPYEQAEPYTHFMVSRPDSGFLTSPWWDPVAGEQEWDAGDYVLCAGLRVPGGSVCARMRSFAVRPGEPTEVTLPVDVGPGGWDPSRVFFNGPPVDSIDALLRPVTAADPPFGPPPARGLFFFFVPGEPATRMIEALGRVVARLEREGIPFVPVLVGEGKKRVWLEKLADAGCGGTLLHDQGGVLLPLGTGAGPFEPIVMLREGASSVLLVRRGFDSAVDATVHLALDLMEQKR